MIEHARSSADEVCGVLIGRRAPWLIAHDVLPGRNLHPHPDRHFLLDPHTLLHADTLARAQGHAIIGFYHSHPSGGSVPSMHDRRAAWPDHALLIIAMPQPRQPFISAWRVSAHSFVQPVSIGLAP